MFLCKMFDTHYLQMKKKLVKYQQSLAKQDACTVEKYIILKFCISD